MGRPGFEPGTNDLKGRCSTIELPTQVQLHTPNHLTDLKLYTAQYRFGERQMQGKRPKMQIKENILHESFAMMQVHRVTTRSTTSLFSSLLNKHRL